MIKVQALKCLVCGSTIYSRARRDFHWCECKSCFVDGGRDYFRYGGNVKDFKLTTIKLDATEEILFKDWNTGQEKYGIIYGKKKKVRDNKKKTVKRTKVKGVNKG